MSKKLLSIMLLLAVIVLSVCVTPLNKEPTQIRYRFASGEEGTELLLGNKKYYEGFSQNDLDFRAQKKNATMDEYLDFAREQILDFTDEEKRAIDECFVWINDVLKENGYTLPEIDEIVLIKMTDYLEGAMGFTHGTQIYLSESFCDILTAEDEELTADYDYVLNVILLHELFHCLTRCNPIFRADMYKLIHFTVADKDFTIPPSAFEYHISNPDVEHHDSYATFHINGQDIECFTDFITTKHFEEEGELFFDFFETALIPIDGSDVYYTSEQADNFYEVFGANTDYVVDPEECMADNFSFAIAFGMDGYDGEGYPNPEIIEGIMDYLKAK